MYAACEKQKTRNVLHAISGPIQKVTYEFGQNQNQTWKPSNQKILNSTQIQSKYYGRHEKMQILVGEYDILQLLYNTANCSARPGTGSCRNCDSTASNYPLTPGFIYGTGNFSKDRVFFFSPLFRLLWSFRLAEQLLMSLRMVDFAYEITVSHYAEYTLEFLHCQTRLPVILQAQIYPNSDEAINEAIAIFYEARCMCRFGFSYCYVH